MDIDFSINRSQNSSNMFQFQLFGATVAFHLQFTPTVIEASFKIAFPRGPEVEIKGRMTVGGQMGVRRGPEDMV